MKESELKNKLKGLWKDTFHDSDEYISLVFDTYFDADLCAYEVQAGDVVAGLIGVPYKFGNDERNIAGLYLCGLATNARFRSQGIMTRLLSEINEKARKRGFSFTFLIPADAGLRKYYQDREYVNAFYRVVNNYTSLHDFDREYESILQEQKEKVASLKRRYASTLSCGMISQSNLGDEAVRGAIKKLIRSIEDVQDDLQLIHSDGDIDVLIRENTVSGGEIHYVMNQSGGVTAVAFVTTSLSDSCVNIHKLYSTDLASKYKVLGCVKHSKPDLGIRHYVSTHEMDSKALWSRTYGSFMPNAPQVDTISITERVYSLAAHSRVYGMARILDLYEILKFQAENRRDLKYSILTKSDNPYILEQIDVRDGRLNAHDVPISQLTASQTAHIMTKRDIGEILFRRRDTDNLITEAFGIPSINGSICLMLD